jgi:hypothetical protein
MGTAAPQTGYRAARGYEPLTPFQWEQFQEALLELCQPGKFGEVRIVVEAGKPILIQAMSSKKFSPVRA